MTDESCCDAEREGGQIVAGWTKPTEDNANDTAISTFNTCLASKQTMKQGCWNKALKAHFLNWFLTNTAESIFPPKFLKENVVMNAYSDLEK